MMWEKRRRTEISPLDFIARLKEADMAVAISLERYLIKNRIRYDVMLHQPTQHSMATAHAAGVPAGRLAKSVVLCDELDFLVAVVPATHSLQLGRLRMQLARAVRLATEAEILSLFSDCAGGAIPPVGPAYGLEVIIDDSLNEQPEIFFEGGDHQELIRVAGADFQRLLPNALHGRFSRISSGRHGHVAHEHL
jgi:Ala-tRNA(Pro) deacylase